MKYLQLDINGRYITFRDINDYREGCIEVPDDFPEPPDIFRYRYENGQWIEIQAPERLLTLEETKQIKLQEIQNSFINEMSNGYIDFTIPSSGIQVQVDARRRATNNDLQNVEGLIELITLNIIQAPVLYKCYDNEKYEMTLSDLQALKIALMAKGLQLYAKKHYLEDLVEQATTIEELEQIVW